ncbi:hypothetical protein ACSBR1_033398 [Camellia fascicularis]
MLFFWSFLSGFCEGFSIGLCSFLFFLFSSFFLLSFFLLLLLLLLFIGFPRNFFLFRLLIFGDDIYDCRALIPGIAANCFLPLLHESAINPCICHQLSSWVSHSFNAQVLVIGCCRVLRASMKHI